MLPCPKCSYDNELGRIFCHQCGQKLDLDAIKPPSRGGKSLRPKDKQAVAKRIRHVIELLLLAGFLYLFFVMLQVTTEPAMPTIQESTLADKKWLSLERLVGKRQAGSIELTPAEASALLANMRVDSANMKWGLVPDRIWMKFAAGSVEVNVLATFRLGGVLEKKLWLTYSGAPKVEGGQFAFEPTGGTFGRLRWPLPLVKAVGFHRRLFGIVFGRFTIQKDTLSQLSQIDVRPDLAILQYQPH
ncbi:MAG: zinc ribbon domain-containing protein [Verrucomicrobia bacterium]|nr:zinc ribbon domain-containing protein [Verrucomicrobiota bacterium]